MGPFLVTLFISIFFLLMQFLWKYIDDMVGKGLALDVVGQLIFYASATFVPMALPLAILLSSLMTFGNLGEYYELVALKSAGVSLQRIMFPLIILSIGISFFAFIFANNVMPVANLKFRSLLHDIRQQRPDFNLKPGIFYDGIEDYIIKVSSKNKENNMLYDIIIYDHTGNKGNTNVTIADSAKMQVTDDETTLLLTLYHGRKYQELKEERQARSKLKYPHQQSVFDKEIVSLDLSGFGLKRSEEEIFKDNEDMMSISQLRESEDSLKYRLEQKKKSFGKNLLKTNYFKREKKIKESDLYLKNLRPQINTDSVVKSFKKDEKKKLIEKAIQDARKVKESLNKGKKTSSVAENVLKTDYFERREIDSLKIKEKKQAEVKIDIDSLFDGLSNFQKNKIIKRASNFARSTKSYINSTGNDYEFRNTWIIKHKIEWHRKFSLSFACLVLFFIGAPLGAIIRKGGFGMPVVVAILFFLFYYIITIIGEKMVEEHVIPAYQGMWLSAAILLPLGIFLTSKATSDSVIFDMEAYKVFFKKITGITIRKKRKRMQLLAKIKEQEVSDNRQLLTEMNKLSSNAKTYIKEDIKKFKFFNLLYKFYVFNDQKRMTEIIDSYKNTLGIIQYKSKDFKYFKEKLDEIPDIRLKVYKKTDFVKVLNNIINMISVPLFPLTLIVILLYRIQVKTKLKSIITIIDDMINVLSNDELYKLKVKANAYSNADK